MRIDLGIVRTFPTGEGGFRGQHVKVTNLSIYLDPGLYGTLTLSILTITQRHGDDGVVSSKCVCVGSGRAKDEGWVIGGLWGGVGVCTVHKHRVVPALP